MRRALEATALAGLAIGTLTVSLLDPDQPFAIWLLVGAVALVVGALSSRVLLAAARAGRSARARSERSRALRRGAALGAIAGILLALRAIDGFTPLTAGFVILAFALAEVALTARTPSVR